MGALRFQGHVASGHVSFVLKRWPPGVFECKLLQGPIITVSEENRRRGILEKVYTLPEHQADLGQDDLAHAS